VTPWTLTMNCARCGAPLRPYNAVAHQVPSGACTRLMVMTVCDEGHGMEVLVTMAPFAVDGRDVKLRQRRHRAREEAQAADAPAVPSPA